MWGGEGEREDVEYDSSKILVGKRRKVSPQRN